MGRKTSAWRLVQIYYHSGLTIVVFTAPYCFWKINPDTSSCLRVLHKCSMRSLLPKRACPSPVLKKNSASSGCVKSGLKRKAYSLLESMIGMILIYLNPRKPDSIHQQIANVWTIFCFSEFDQFILTARFKSFVLLEDVRLLYKSMCTPQCHYSSNCWKNTIVMMSLYALALHFPLTGSKTSFPPTGTRC